MMNVVRELIWLKTRGSIKQFSSGWMSFPVLNIMFEHHGWSVTVSLSLCWVILTRNQAEAFPMAADQQLDEREMYPTPTLSWCTQPKEQGRNCNSCKTISCTGFLGAIPCSLQSFLTLCSAVQTQVSLWMDLEPSRLPDHNNEDMTQGKGFI